jgi:hypothetical protein
MQMATVARVIVLMAHSVIDNKTYGVQWHPNQHNPFVFFHDPKTAGSTLRRYFSRAAARQRYPFFIPCYGGVGCMTYGIKSHPKHRQQSIVLAGHFQWGIQNDLQLEEQNKERSSPPNEISCFTMLRDPYQRTISYYYERIFPSFPLRMADLEPEQLQDLLTHFVRVSSQSLNSIDKIASSMDVQTDKSNSTVASDFIKHYVHQSVGGTFTDEG